MSRTEINTITSGVVIIDKDNNVLLNKRDPQETLFPNLFSIPAGKHILGETLEETAIREVEEEVQLNLDRVVFVNAYFWDNNVLFVFASKVNSFDGIGTPHKKVADNTLAPNIKTAIKEALEINTNYFNNISIRKIIINGTLLINDNKIEIEGKIGWDHFIFQNRIGILGTAIGLCILEFNNNISNLGSISQTLLSFQKDDGGWGIRGADNENSILECTCYCIKALYNLDPENYAIQINNAKEWIIRNRLQDFSWGVNDQSKMGRVTPTCLAIETLLMLGEVEIVQDSIIWLLRNRNEDCGWGFNSLSQSCLSATSIVLSLLININKFEYGEYIKAGIFWLENQIKIKFIYDESEQEYINGAKRFEFKHSTKVKVLKALVQFQDSLNKTNIHKLINEIINCKNNNGAWEHSLTPNNFPIWHLYDIVELLDFIEKRYNVDNLTLFNMNFDQLRVQKYLLEFISKNIPKEIKHYKDTKFS